MRNFWISWYGENGVFELHSPWWISGTRCADDAEVFCAAVRAMDEDAAWDVIRQAHDDKTAPIEARFCEERPADWSPFNGRFRKADWMKWPEAQP